MFSFIKKCHIFDHLKDFFVDITFFWTYIINITMNRKDFDTLLSI